MPGKQANIEKTVDGSASSIHIALILLILRQQGEQIVSTPSPNGCTYTPVFLRKEFRYTSPIYTLHLFYRTLCALFKLVI
ncbi:hypothetical protein [Thermoflavimicrobium dichotomicum]|uniref:hypothetical protein n=1 Tax=Thermoflavimicrobium dichotomicum TaxID=46223 RepID=UPI000B82133E|nr:hypothetical protein [Thermoflavimicrobium dichotomicum]